MPFIATDQTEPLAITIEDGDPFMLVGEEADAPSEVGRDPDREDAEPSATLAPPPEADFDEFPEIRGRSWRPAKSLVELRHEVNTRWPRRDKRTDGMIGDDEHCGAGKTSDHCPNALGVVRAYDIDVDGIRAAWLAEHIRQLGMAGDPRLANGGYVIYNRRIASEVGSWRWRRYGGHPHQDHIHTSVGRNAAAYDYRGDWGVARAHIPPPADDRPRQDGLPEFTLGERTLRFLEGGRMMLGTDVAYVQRWTGADDDGWFGRRTEERVMRFQGIVGVDETGVVDPDTWAKMRVTVPAVG